MVRSQRCKRRCAMWAFCDFTVTRTDKCTRVPSDRYKVATDCWIDDVACRQGVLFVRWFVCRSEAGPVADSAPQYHLIGAMKPSAAASNASAALTQYSAAALSGRRRRAWAAAARTAWCSRTTPAADTPRPDARDARAGGGARGLPGQQELPPQARICVPVRDRGSHARS